MQDIEPVEEPLPEVSENEYAASDDQGDVHDGARVGPDDEPPKPQSTKVFVNNLFTRMQSGVQRSFKTFTSFGDRERSSGLVVMSIPQHSGSLQAGPGKKEPLKYVPFVVLHARF